MKYAVLNCWTDDNKGDLGIMLSTISEIRKQDPASNIIGVSCFSNNDPYFSHCHNILKEYVDKMCPAIFGVVVLKIGNFTSKHILLKLMMSIFETVRMVLAVSLPPFISWKFLFESEKQTLSEIKECNVSISKGGSIFIDYATVRGKFALFRTCMFYFLLHKHDCPFYILGQSFGPVHGKVTPWLVNKVVEMAEKVYLRETICVNQYRNIKIPQSKTGFSNDTAFLLEQQKTMMDDIHESNFNVGFTVRPAGKNKDQYVVAIRDTIVYFVDVYNAYVHFFRQVSGKDEPDDVMINEIYHDLSEHYKNRVVIHSSHYRPQQLKYLYGQMKMLIGTRLHSTIFALGAETPSICLVYHGTKAQGIFENLGLEKFVITDIKSRVIIEKAEEILENYCYTKNILKIGVEKAKQQTVDAIAEIISRSRQRSRQKENFHQ